MDSTFVEVNRLNIMLVVVSMVQLRVAHMVRRVVIILVVRFLSLALIVMAEFEGSFVLDVS